MRNTFCKHYIFISILDTFVVIMVTKKIVNVSILLPFWMINEKCIYSIDMIWTHSLLEKAFECLKVYWNSLEATIYAYNLSICIIIWLLCPIAWYFDSFINESLIHNGNQTIPFLGILTNWDPKLYLKGINMPIQTSHFISIDKKSHNRIWMCPNILHW